MILGIPPPPLLSVFTARKNSPLSLRLIMIIIIIIIKRQFISRNNKARVTTRAPYNVRRSYSGNSQSVNRYVLSMFLNVDNVGAERMSSGGLFRRPDQPHIIPTLVSVMPLAASEITHIVSGSALNSTRSLTPHARRCMHLTSD